ncbi:MAG: hypothetical protein NZM38_09610 [Cytophagales bacterium]|nr:hypothetical protein [Cytophagales bacterium]MDW8385013.1 hypothetical protein [Flammeovirgaceae bacterium]
MIQQPLQLSFYSWKWSYSASLQKDFVYTYSFQFSWINFPENHLLHVRFANGNELHLTNRYLYARAGSVQQKWLVPQIRNIYFQRKRFILPILTGGILLPFTILAFHAHVISAWISGIFVLIGIMLLYYGFAGEQQLTIVANNLSYHLFVGNDTEILQKSVSILHRYLTKKV